MRLPINAEDPRKRVLDLGKRRGRERSEAAQKAPSRDGADPPADRATRAIYALDAGYHRTQRGRGTRARERHNDNQLVRGARAQLVDGDDHGRTVLTGLASPGRA